VVDAPQVEIDATDDGRLSHHSRIKTWSHATPPTSLMDIWIDQKDGHDLVLRWRYRLCGKVSLYHVEATRMTVAYTCR